MPLFTVVIPTYNRRERLLRALGSVFAQRYQDYEVVVVDDGSTDRTAEALEALAGRITLLRQSNRGPAAARNAGVGAAKGEYVAFLDSDDRWPPWVLGRHAALIAAHSRPTWLFGRKWVDAKEAADRDIPEGPLEADCFDCYLRAAAVEGLTPSTAIVVRREAFLRSGGFSETLRVGEDFDLWFRLLTEPGFVLLHSPAALVREHHDTTLTLNVPLSLAGMLELLRKERAGLYGGDEEAAFARRAVLTRQLIYYALQYGMRGRRDLSARFYLEILRLQAASRFREPPSGGSRNRFLVTFPLFLASPRLHALFRRALGKEPLEDALT